MEGPNPVNNQSILGEVSKPSVDKSILQGTNDAAQIESVRKNKKIKKKRIPFFVKVSAIIFVIFLVCLSGLFLYTDSEKDKVVSGTTIKLTDEEVVDISNMDYKEAQDKLAESVNEYLDRNFEISYSSMKKSSTLKNMGITFDYSKAMEEIVSSVYGPYIYESMKKHMDKPTKAIPAFSGISLNESMLDTFISNEFKEIEKKPKDAVLFVNKDKKLEITKETLGIAIDKSKLFKDIVSIVNSAKYSAVVPILDVKPAVTEEILKDMIPVKQIAKFGTNFGGSISARVHNIKLAASRINNTLLKPGEEFEFFKYVGDTASPRDGFKIAGVYVNGKVSTDYGGGICQVSTTLYNAVLLADLEITKRAPHSMPVHYVPLGRDATVSQGVQTLKFKNNTDKYILIKAETKGSNLYFSIYGYMPAGKSVKVRSNTLSSLSAVAYRDVYMNGKRVRTDYLGKCVYKKPKSET